MGQRVQINKLKSTSFFLTLRYCPNWELWQ